MRTRGFAAVLLVVVTLLAFAATRDTPVREALLSKPSPAEIALDRVLPELLIDGLPFDEAVARLQAVGKARLVVDWPALEAAQIDRRTRVHLQVRGIRFSDALSRVLAQVCYGRNADTLAFAPDGGAIVVGLANSRQYTRCYDVRTLLPTDSVASAEPGVPPAPNPPGAYCLSDGLFNGHAHRDEAASQLAQFISETVAPDTWRVNGGSVGTIQFTAGRMVVVTTWDNHRKIEALLGMLHHPVPPPSARPDEWLAWDARAQQWVSGTPDLAERSLGTVLPEVRIEDAPLEEAVRSLARLARANIVVDGKSLAAAELDRKYLQDAGADMSRSRRRTLHLYDVTLEGALKAVLQEYSDSVWTGGFIVDADVIVVSGSGAAPLVTRVYDLRDWPHPGAAAERRHPSNAVHGTRYRDTDELLERITTTVAPESWSENGGPGRIVCMADRVVVTQTWRNHEGVRRFMAAASTGPAPRRQQ